MTERSAFAPDVFRTDGGTIAFVDSVIFGDRGVYRTTSRDGVEFSEPQRVLDGVGGPFVLPQQTGFLGFFSLYDASGSAIARSSSPDGIAWEAPTPLVAAGADVGANELTGPKAWRHGDVLHLYFNAYRDICFGDVCAGSPSVEHATSRDDGLTFTIEDPVLSATGCPDGSASSFLLTALARNACAAPDLCGEASLAILVQMSACDRGEQGSFLFESGDGFVFSEPRAAPAGLMEGTILTAGDAAIIYEGSYADGSIIRVRPFPQEPGLCSDP